MIDPLAASKDKDDIEFGDIIHVTLEVQHKNEMDSLDISNIEA